MVVSLLLPLTTPVPLLPFLTVLLSIQETVHSVMSVQSDILGTLELQLAISVPLLKLTVIFVLMTEPFVPHVETPRFLRLSQPLPLQTCV